MRCFKLFFKHTWHPQQIDNPSSFATTQNEEVNENGTELDEVKVVSINEPSTSRQNKISCSNGGCQKTVMKKAGAESPWHYYKTIFLIFFIVALIVWIIVYTLLSSYDLL
ncbi:hypothetical protein HCN44_008662 [Aphidius gifuensis]|uniref:Uncharacterized protein n=1 Tax=Aphidius gifuensis TaxID=684658 RepID=A0A835CQA8_APHGI|nr:hypothetical protein HCN44_008662 [Aphidius gifuensis]